MSRYSLSSGEARMMQSLPSCIVWSWEGHAIGSPPLKSKAPPGELGDSGRLGDYIELSESCAVVHAGNS